MKQAFENKGEPLAAPSGLLVFHDWRFVHPSYPGWQVPESFGARMREEGAQPGTYTALTSAEPLPTEPLRFDAPDMPRGIRIAACPPELVARQGPSGPIIREDGRYRMWYVKPARMVPGREVADENVMSQVD